MICLRLSSGRFITKHRTKLLQLHLHRDYRTWTRIVRLLSLSLSYCQSNRSSLFIHAKDGEREKIVIFFSHFFEPDLPEESSLRTMQGNVLLHAINEKNSNRAVERLSDKVNSCKYHCLCLFRKNVFFSRQWSKRVICARLWMKNWTHSHSFVRLDLLVYVYSVVIVIDH